MKINKSFLFEKIISPLEGENFLNFWHGGNLENDFKGRKRGRYEYGVGLYMITNYDVAYKYSKGNRRLYLLTVEKGVDLKDHAISIRDAYNFVNNNVIGKKKKEIISRIGKYEKNGFISGRIFDNSIINNDAILASKAENLSEFYINQGIDYHIVNNPFGWGSEMMILFNMKKIIRKIRVETGDKIEVFDIQNQ